MVRCRLRESRGRRSYLRRFADSPRGLYGFEVIAMRNLMPFLELRLRFKEREGNPEDKNAIAALRRCLDKLSHIEEKFYRNPEGYSYKEGIDAFNYKRILMLGFLLKWRGC